jgi:putative transport protein
MPWYAQLLTGANVAGVVLGLCVAATLGLAVGSVKVQGLSLGIAGVLFAGIGMAFVFWSHALLVRLGGGSSPEVARAVEDIEQRRHEILEFTRELGLVLFVYSIGIQVGPGFFSSLRAQGLRWNLMAVVLVALDLLVTVVVHRWLKVDAIATVGLMSGAVTNTPGLAAAEQALRDLPALSAERRGMAEVGYAVAYPFGVFGTILSLLLVRVVARLDPKREAERFERAVRQGRPLANIDLRIANPAVIGMAVERLPGLLGAPVVVSRLMRRGRVEVPSASTELAAGDLLHVVGEQAALERLAYLLGEKSGLDLRQVPGDLGVRRLVVTRGAVVGRTLAELELLDRHGVNVTRVLRAGLELVPNPGVELRFGDTLVAVGEEDRLASLEAMVGNSAGELEHAQLVPIFVGIALGVLLGSVPVHLGGLPAPVRLGLAGGPLLVALGLSHLGRLGRISFYLPNSANLMLRDLGIVLFLGCVGLLSGERFVDTLVHGPGLRWILYGCAITLPPLLVMELLARLVGRMDYTALCGVVAGSMTSPSVLSFATQAAGDGASVAYGAVYPLALILRVVTTQVLTVLWVASP